MRAVADIVVAVAAIIAVGHVAAVALRRVGQPAVLGQILAGVLLGPSALGLLSLDGQGLGAAAGPALRDLANLGLVVFMLVVGLEVDPRALAGRGRAAASIACASVAVPLALGAAVAIPLHAHHAALRGNAVDVAPFALFVGTALSITAFPVLAAILGECGLRRTEVGALALAAAACGDAAGWTLLAFTLAVAHGSDAAGFASVAGAALCFLAAVRWTLRPFVLAPIAARHARLGRLRRRDAALVVGIALGAAQVSDAIGLHALIGAFVVGGAMPRPETREAAARALRPAAAILAPAAFAIPGLSLQLGDITGADAVDLLVVLAAASIGKVAGVAATARRQGVDAGDAATLGILMNTRGLVEVIVLTVGRSAGILDERLFAVLLAMAILTTLATAPIVKLISRWPRAQRQPASRGANTRSHGIERTTAEPWQAPA